VQGEKIVVPEKFMSATCIGTTTEQIKAEIGSPKRMPRRGIPAAECQASFERVVLSPLAHASGYNSRSANGRRVGSGATIRNS